MSVTSYENLSKQPQKAMRILPSRSTTVNFVAALNLLDRHKIPLDPANSSGRQHEIAKLTHSLATDLNKSLPISIGGTVKEYFIGDNNIVVDRANLEAQDGDYINITVGGNTSKIFLNSEIDHAYIVDPNYLRQIEMLLGGTGEQTISVSAEYSDNLEYNYSLNLNGESPWEKFYFAKLILSSIDTLAPHSRAPYLSTTTARYEIVDHTTTDGLREVEDLVRYTANYAVQSIHHDDVMMNYITSTGKFTVSRQDFLDDAPKTFKRRPIFARQVPRYYIIFPTTREEFLTFGAKSKITSIGSNIVYRHLNTVPFMTKSSRTDPNNFLNIKFALSNDVPGFLGDISNGQARYVSLNPDSKIYTQGYKPGLGGETEPPRTKDTFRICKEIIEDLYSNYVLERQGIGFGLNKSDVFFRLSGMEYNKGVVLENINIWWPQIRAGLIRDVKVFPATTKLYSSTFGASSPADRNKAANARK